MTFANRVKSLHAAGKPSFGLIATIPSIPTVQILARAGFDWLIIDMEHGPIDLAAAHAMITATAGSETVPFVRVAANQHHLAKPLLDLGALGVCFPMVNSAADAAAAVRAVRYPPVGERYWGPFFAPLRWDQSMPGYIAGANDAVMAIATIEHRDAISSIDDIAATPGLDLAFIGIGDLAMSLALPGQYDNPRVQDAVARAEAGILRSGVALGGVARTPQEVKALLDRGYRAIVLTFDWMLLQRAALDFLQAARAAA